MSNIIEISGSRPVIGVEEIKNPHNGWREVVLKLPLHLGESLTDLGMINLKRVSIGINILPPNIPINSWLSNNVMVDEPWSAIWVPGAVGEVVMDLSQTLLPGRDMDNKRILLHRKGVGARQLDATTRLWVDVGTRIAQPSGWEQPVSRWSPISR